VAGPVERITETGYTIVEDASQAGQDGDIGVVGEPAGGWSPCRPWMRRLLGS
jgi:hypothetical protein